MKHSPRLYRLSFLPFLVILILGLCGAGTALGSVKVPQTPLDATIIPKYVDPMPTFGPGAGSIARVTNKYITVRMQEFQQQILPTGFNPTWVWGYKVGNRPALYPGVTVEAQRGQPNTMVYINQIPWGAHSNLQPLLTVDQTIHWADPLNAACFMNPAGPGCFAPYRGPVPAVVHLHGGETLSDYDGGPDQWFTRNGLHGQSYRTASLPPTAGSAIYFYNNSQEATALWFHDHALGTTRLNVYGGLEAFYLLRDRNSADTGVVTPNGLPAGVQEMEILIQDRQFDTNGQLYFPDGSGPGLNGPPTNPTVHPFWNPEFFGDAIVVNGKSWPFLNVEPKRYRFRLLNGSNARFYVLTLGAAPNQLPMWQIGTDGGLLDAPVLQNQIVLAPAERADIIVDFTGQAAGTTFTVFNSANAPYPGGTPPDPNTTGQIMQFRVVAPTTADVSCDPSLPLTDPAACLLRPANPIVKIDPAVTGTPADKVRQLVLREVMGPGGPLEVLLNNTKWMGLDPATGLPIQDSVLGPDGVNYFTELPQVGSTEIWQVINTTGDAHPIHIHLIQFQLLTRQNFQTVAYTTLYESLFPGGVFQPAFGPPLPYNTPNTDGAIGGNPAVSPFLTGAPRGPRSNENGWKDTVQMNPHQVTTIAVRFSPQDTPANGVSAGVNLFRFDATSGPGYVWHCHILDHEDNEMMRPYALVP